MSRLLAWRSSNLPTHICTAYGQGCYPALFLLLTLWLFSWVVDVLGGWHPASWTAGSWEQGSSWRTSDTQGKSVVRAATKTSSSNLASTAWITLVVHLGWLGRAGMRLSSCYGSESIKQSLGTTKQLEHSNIRDGVGNCPPTPVLSLGKSHGWRSLVGWQAPPWGCCVRHNWATSLSLFTFMHWKRKWQPIPVFLLGESQGWCAHTELDMTDVT